MATPLWSGRPPRQELGLNFKESEDGHAKRQTLGRNLGGCSGAGKGVVGFNNQTIRLNPRLSTAASGWACGSRMPMAIVH
jgi:hypothetical protein